MWPCSGMAAAVSVTAVAVAATSAVRTCSRRSGDCQGGHSRGQNQPGHDTKLPLVSGHQRKYGNSRSSDEVRFTRDEPHLAALE
jgi:hypothetical protein